MESAKMDRRRTVPVAREELEVERRRVDTGGVRVRKTVSERVQHVSESVTREEVAVDRVVVNRIVEAPSGPRQEGDVLVIPVFEEIITVERKWLLKEELRVSKHAVQVPFRDSVVLLEEHAVVERAPAEEEK
jgi:uncharacterized protein (TIGR02271 family)